MRSGLFLAVVVVLSACPTTSTPDGGAPSDGKTLTLTGRVCTTAPDFGSFTTRVFVLLDQRALMCRINPPGASTDLSGFCPSLTGLSPTRNEVLTQFFQQLAPQNVSVALIPYSARFDEMWPSRFNGGFTAQPDSTLTAQLSQLHLSLGDELSDLQGALEFVAGAIESDAQRLTFTTVDQVSRTKFVVIIISAGPPAPRCNSNDTRPKYADDLDPSGEWPDSHPICNDPAAQQRLPFLRPGQSRNQDSTLLAPVFAMREALGRLRIGDLRVHTVQLTDVEALVACGAPCAQLLGRKLRNGVDVPVSEVPAFSRVEGRAILERIAEVGGGSYVEQLPPSFSLDHVDTATLFAPNAKRSFFVKPRHAVLESTGWVLDSDGDGVSDEKETAAGTSVLKPDTDDDGFTDSFELARVEQGFDPLLVDTRGCPMMLPFCNAPDVDGDQLDLLTEAFLGTNATVADTDGDGVPDGLEVRAGLSPTVSNEGRDVDGDGVRDVDEVMRGTNPLVADAELGALVPRVEVVDDTDIGNGARCFRYTVTKLPMVATKEGRAPSVFTPAGANQFKLWFSWAPKDASFSVGEWASACAWARLDGEKRVPASLSLELERVAFGPPQDGSRQCAGETEALKR